MSKNFKLIEKVLNRKYPFIISYEYERGYNLIGISLDLLNQYFPNIQQIMFKIDEPMITNFMFYVLDPLQRNNELMLEIAEIDNEIFSFVDRVHKTLGERTHYNEYRYLLIP